MVKIHGYSSPFNLTHKEAQNFFDGSPYIVQEKIDGSQFSFGVYELEDLHIACRSHGAQINLDEPPKMFLKGIETVKNMWGNLQVGWTYRGELLDKPKHNTLQYSRVPVGNIILYDIDKGDQDYLIGDEFYQEAERIGLETVPCFAITMRRPDAEDIENWLSRTSVLGGTLIEGVVLKNYDKYGIDKKVLMVKIVSERFKETHNKDWKDRNPSQTDVVTKLIAEYGSEARWQKSVQHLNEEGLLEHDAKDIGILMKEFCTDFEKECAEEIKEELWKHFRKDIIRGISKGLPEWYKNTLYQDFLGETDAE